jgi:hypothetical protein
MNFLEKYWWVIAGVVALWWYANYRTPAQTSPAASSGASGLSSLPGNIVNDINSTAVDISSTLNVDGILYPPMDP